MKILRSVKKVNPTGLRIRRKQRALIYVAVFLGLIGIYTLAYKYGMAAFEGEHRSFIHSLQIVVETMTTTGYGEDAPWTTVPMNLLMIAMQFTGILAIFLTLPLFVVPWMEEALKTTVPRTTPKMRDHIVICGTNSAATALVAECRSRDLEYVLVEPDKDTAVRLHKDGVRVMLGDPEQEEVLRKAHADTARVIVTDTNDETTASIVLAARDLAADAQIISLIEHPAIAKYISYAGADSVLSPRHLLGVSLADKVATSVTAELGDTISIGEDLEVAELPIQRNSSIAGKTLRESGLWREAGASIIGAWLRGEFVSAPGPDTYIDEQSVLLVAGAGDQLEHLRDLTLSKPRTYVRSNVIVVGYGEVGTTIDDALARANIDTTIVDSQEMEGVDVVGDAADEDVLKAAGIDDAGAIIIAVGDDTTATFATLLARKRNEDIEIVVRANETENIGKLYRAGADYVLALETVSGRMIARNMLGEEVLDPGQQIKLVRTPADKLTGKRLDAEKIRNKTGCSLVAVERDGEVITHLHDRFQLREEDTLIVAGTDDNITAFTKTYGT